MGKANKTSGQEVCTSVKGAPPWAPSLTGRDLKASPLQMGIQPEKEREGEGEREKERERERKLTRRARFPRNQFEKLV